MSLTFNLTCIYNYIGEICNRRARNQNKDFSVGETVTCRHIHKYVQNAVEQHL